MWSCVGFRAQRARVQLVCGGYSADAARLQRRSYGGSADAALHPGEEECHDLNGEPSRHVWVRRFVGSCQLWRTDGGCTDRAG